MLASMPVSSHSLNGIRRWTVGALASHKPSAHVARVLLEDVTTRLEQQISICENIKKEVSGLVDDSQSRLMVQKQLDFLRHVHVDTTRQCRQVLQREPLWPRWNVTDQRIVRQCMEQVRDRHAPSLERWVDIALALRSNTTSDETNGPFSILLEHALQGRLSIQMLTNHYSLLADENLSRRRPTGTVAVQHSLEDLIHDAYTEAHFLCEAHHQHAPDLECHTNNLSVTVVRPWMTHVLVEVCKNAMSATAKRQLDRHYYNNHDDYYLPPLQISATLCHDARSGNNNKDHDCGGDGVVVLEVRDHGVGLPPPPTAMDPFGWGVSSSRQRWDRLKEQQSYAAVRPPLASLGVGLPTSRAMMRHFGGDLELVAPACDEGCIARITIPQNLDIPELLPPHFVDWVVPNDDSLSN